MPSKLAELYQENKRIRGENTSILGTATPVTPYMPSLKQTTPAAIGSISDYEDYIPNPESIMSWADPNAIRARQQSVGEQLGNMALRAPINIALGTMSNIAASLDIEDYFNMDDEVGNPISNLMNEWQESIRQSNPIYRERPGSTFDVRDSGWWIDNASMLLESAGAFVVVS